MSLIAVVTEFCSFVILSAENARFLEWNLYDPISSRAMCSTVYVCGMYAGGCFYVIFIYERNT